MIKSNRVNVEVAIYMYLISTVVSLLVSGHSVEASLSYVAKFIVTLTVDVFNSPARQSRVRRSKTEREAILVHVQDNHGNKITHSQVKVV